MSWNKEPTVIINGFLGLLTQILPLLVIMGFITLTPEKLAALISISGLLLTFILTTLLRSQVVPTERRDEQVITAVSMPKGTKLAEVIQENAERNEGADAT